MNRIAVGIFIRCKPRTHSRPATALAIYKSRPGFAIATLRKYVATRDREVLRTIDTLYRERLMLKPTPAVAKSMHDLLSRSSPKVSGVSRRLYRSALRPYAGKFRLL